MATSRFATLRLDALRSAGRRRSAAVVAVCALFFAAVFLPAPDAAAYVSLKYGDSEMRWSNTTVRYYIHSNGSADVTMTELEGAIAAALQSWQDVTCSRIAFTYGGRRSTDPRDGVFFRFQESNWDPTVGDAAAYSTPTSMSWSGEIRATEIVFNGQDQTWTTNAAEAAAGYKSDIQGVAAHELGHSLGLAHTRHPEATMFFSSGLSAELRTLEDDDERGVCYLYPNGTFASGQVCDSCTANGQCANGTCVTYYQEPDLFCGFTCNTSSDCPQGYICYTDYYPDSGLNQCVPTNGYCDDSGSNVEMGDFCYGYEVCESGLFCLATGSGAYCSRECGSGCPDGFECYSNYCLQGGAAQLGESCQSSMDCRSFVCATLEPGHYVCSQECAVDADCPSGYGCAWEMCFRRGDLSFGSACGNHTDCQTAYCAGYGAAKYCSDNCASDDDCPVGAYCTSNDYCSKVSTDTGDPCTRDGDCPDGNLCLFEDPNAAYGVCRKSCNPYTGFTCPSGDVCRWVEMSWLETIAGVCEPENGGPREGDPCNLNGPPCEWGSICASYGDSLSLCRAHCRTDTSMGCISSERCVWLNQPDQPHHGFCWSEPPPPVDVVQPPADVVQPDTAQPPVDAVIPPRDTGQPSQDTGWPPPQDTGWTPPYDSGWTPQDTGVAPQPGTDSGAPPTGADGSVTGTDNGLPLTPGTPPGGGCTTGSGPSPAPLGLLALLLLLAVTRRRTV